jgi:hypothetical protein
MKYFIRTRPLKYAFLKNWYARRIMYYYPEYDWIIDIGFITIGKRK